MGEVAALRGLAQQTLQHVWYPFTQHTGLRAEDITTIDARSGEHMLVFRGGQARGGLEHIEPRFDACASWWTQVRPSLPPQSIEQGQMLGLPSSDRQQMSCDPASITSSSDLAQLVLQAIDKHHINLGAPVIWNASARDGCLRLSQQPRASCRG